MLLNHSRYIATGTFTIDIPAYLFHLKSTKLDIFCKYLIIGGVHLYLGYKGIATDSGFLQSNSCLYDNNKRYSYRCSGHYLHMRTYQ